MLHIKLHRRYESTPAEGTEIQTISDIFTITFREPKITIKSAEVWKEACYQMYRCVEGLKNGRVTKIEIGCEE